MTTKIVEKASEVNSPYCTILRKDTKAMSPSISPIFPKVPNVWRVHLQKRETNSSIIHHLWASSSPSLMNSHSHLTKTIPNLQEFITYTSRWSVLVISTSMECNRLHFGMQPTTIMREIVFGESFCSKLCHFRIITKVTSFMATLESWHY